MFFAVERIQRLLLDLEKNRYSGRKELPLRKKPCNYGDYSLLNADPNSFDEYKEHEDWGGKDTHCWFKTSYTVPAKFAGKALFLRAETGKTGWDALNPQFLLFVNGEIRQGMDVNHTEAEIVRDAVAGEIYAIDLYGYTGLMDGHLELSVSIFAMEDEVEKLYYHITVPLEAARLLDEQDKQRLDILIALTEAVNLLDMRQPQSAAFFNSVKAANDYLETEFYQKGCCPGTVTEICVGHTHIDVAWLWPLRQTREKAVRSFSTVVELMKRYPDYIFMSSQPQLYEFVKEDRPELYEEIKRLIAEGRWEAEGAMWLEADCNLTSGESLVRQILFGKRFFKEEFGVDSQILWLPDVFGYSAALPQILQKSGVKYFMTTKISWNEFNCLPYDTFMWKGIDGSKVMTYFVSTQEYKPGVPMQTGTTYNGDTNPASVFGCWQRYQQKEINAEVLNCFGYGDGGGGPTSKMLENNARLRMGIPGMPTVKSGRALDFFRDLETRVGGNKRLPEWAGELYLEYHRGTYTTNARNKRYNRKTEFLNANAELYSSMAATLFGSGYPQQEINSCWKTTLLNQFHDIIPGSSIREVYEDSARQYEEINSLASGITDGAKAEIASKVSCSSESVVVFNPLGFTRTDIARFKLPQGWESAEVFFDSTPVPSQKTPDGDILFLAENIPSKGYRVFELQPVSAAAESLDGIDEPNLLDNRFFSVRFDEDGNITSIFDKRCGREVLQKGQKANTLTAFDDRPHEYDAWNVNIYYQEKSWEINQIEQIQLTEKGPVRTGLKIRRRFLDSLIEQTIYLYKDIPRIDFDTSVDWKETQILLKAGFPVDIHADKATYEIQYGNVERPTHWNTSWDWARFEVCAHKWADISEGGYGVALLNDCKYGYDIKGSNIRLTLLKSPTYPNETSDRTHHEFTYSLYPHEGGWAEGGVTEMAYDLNCPLETEVISTGDGSLPQELSFVKTNAGNILIDIVKKAEDSTDTIIRLYEFQNKRSTASLEFFLPLEYACECDLLENETAPADYNSSTVEFNINPYEIKTFKVRFAKP